MGRNVKSAIFVKKQARLLIGDNVGMTSCCIRCSASITIGNNVKIGALTILSDSDAHSLDPNLRISKQSDAANVISKAITIGDNVFIGANCYISKGVSIGKNSIVGAFSVVTKNIPDNEIWAGNPARFIRNI